MLSRPTHTMWRSLPRLASRRWVSSPPKKVKVIECPRDAMQGLPDFVPTEDKIRYINQLLKVGYDTVDFGSFVSAPAVPQMRDTVDVLKGLDLSNTKSKLLAVVCNVRGAADAAKHPEITYLGFPLSVSETFQRKNTRKDTKEAFETLSEVAKICEDNGKQLVTYISMGFGNPYGEPYSTDMVVDFSDRVVKLGSKVISLSDTVGCGTPETISELFTSIGSRYPSVEVGAHFHSTPNTANEKVRAAIQAGCARLDGAIGGMGGCPFAKSALVGNVPTECIIAYCEDIGIDLGLDMGAFVKAQGIKHELFGVAVSELILQYELDDEEFAELLRKRFDKANVSKTGYLTKGEFFGSIREVIAELGEDPLTDERLERLWVEADTEKSGDISFDEYYAIARNKLSKRIG